MPNDDVISGTGLSAGPFALTGAAAATGLAPTRTAAQVDIPDALSILPVRNLVLFPGTVMPLTIARPASRKLLEESLAQTKIIGVFTQRDPRQDDPGPENLHAVGVAAVVLKLLRQAEDQVLAILHGAERIRIRHPLMTQPYLRAEIDVLAPHAPPAADQEFEAATNQLRSSAIELIDSTVQEADQARIALLNISDAGQLADFLAGTLTLDLQQKQDLLEELDILKRVRSVQLRVSGQLEIARLQRKIQDDVASQFTDAQRRAYLREQVRAIQKELGEGEDSPEQQIEELRQRLNDAKPPEAVMTVAQRELKRLAYIPLASPEHAVIVSYVESLADLPWSRSSDDNLDLDRAQSILDRDHFDLEKVKRRLIEYLAVRKLKPEGRGAILCFLGPPGVGKTSLGQSIADALGRKFVRFSLGGMRDEAEIRGHRRTYIGAMPGQIMQQLRRCGTRNPVMMLDEIDKLGQDFRGDPASALLEVLDPRQNHTFVDRYLDVPFDLSQVMFIGTANYLDPVPPALRDRLEILTLPGYTDSEKLEIARRYLVHRQLDENGLREDQCRFQSDALHHIMADYTREAGVRELERQIGSVCRAMAARIAKGETPETTVTPDHVRDTLGPPRHIREIRLQTSNPGVVTGLAWTPTGGEILHIEALTYPGKGNILLTGHIGEVMKESAQAAFSLVRSRAQQLGIAPETLKDADLHIHVPAGAVPKDGPSAGVAMFTAIASLLSHRPVRADVAMTGEITLRGLILPIGGLKEKALAAHRAQIHTVIFPKLNEKDLPDIPPEILQQLTFVPVDTVDELLAAALHT